MQQRHNKQRLRKLQEFYLRRACAGAAANVYKPRDVCCITNLSRQQFYYWKRKVNDLNFHPRAWGGKRYSKYTHNQQQALQMSIWQMIQSDPSLHIPEICRTLNDYYQLEVKPDWVKDVFHSWHWSWKLAAYKQIHKYTPENIKYYEEYLKAIIFLPLVKIKYLDEVSFSKKDVRRRRCIGRVGQPVLMNERSYINEPSLSAIVLTSIDPRTQPIVGTIKADTNAHSDFNEFVRWCVQTKALQDGDYLIVDNSRIHTSSAGFAELVKFLQDNGIALKLLPKYSPELNPIELVFAFVKHILRNYFDGSAPLKKQIIAAFGLVQRTFIYRCYLHCNNPSNHTVNK